MHLETLYLCICKHWKKKELGKKRHYNVNSHCLGMGESWVIIFFCLQVLSKISTETITFVISKNNQNYHTIPK